MNLRLVLILSCVCAMVLLAQVTGPALVPIWEGRQYVWYRLGSSFVRENGTLEINVPAQPKPRSVGVKLTWDAAASGYRLPAGARNVEMWVNGLHYWAPVDYTLQGDLVIPGTAGNWPPPGDAEVFVNFDP